MRYFITDLIIFLVLIASIVLISKHFVNKLDKVEQLYKDKMGKTIILEGDTLTIIDYSMLNETLTLSNGKKLDVEIVNDSKTIK